MESPNPCECAKPLPPFCVASVGCAHYDGPPSVERVRVIHSLTGVDKFGRRFFRTNPIREWQSLRSTDDFKALNLAINFGCRRPILRDRAEPPFNRQISRPSPASSVFSRLPEIAPVRRTFR